MENYQSPLTPDEQEVLKVFVKSQSSEARLILKLLNESLERLNDLKTLPPHLSVQAAGEEVCARLTACDILEKILVDLRSTDRRKDSISSKSFR